MSAVRPFKAALSRTTKARQKADRLGTCAACKRGIFTGQEHCRVRTPHLIGLVHNPDCVPAGGVS